MRYDARYGQGAVLLEETEGIVPEPQAFAAIDGFLGALGRIRDHFYTVAEFQALDRGRLPAGSLANAMRATEDRLGAFAARLKGRELEGLLLDLRDSREPREIDRAVRILCLRRSARLLKLLTQLYQYNELSPGLDQALSELSACGKAQDVMPVEGAFVWRFGEEEDRHAAVGAAIDEACGSINRCFQTYRIDGRSPFAKESSLRYLGTAGKDALAMNKRWVIAAIEEQEPERLEKLIANYLSSFTLTEYNDGVNMAIQAKIGQPYVSHLWEPYAVELRDRFAEWVYLHQLRIHAFGQPKKISILGSYFSKVRTSWEQKEDGLMVIDFGEIIVADISDRPYSFFYQKDAFEREMALWQKSKENAAAILASRPPELEQLGFAGLGADDEKAGVFQAEEAAERPLIEPRDPDQLSIAEFVMARALEQSEEDEPIYIEGLPTFSDDPLITYKDLLENELEPDSAQVKSIEEITADEVEQGTYLPSFLRIDRKVLTARDFIIEEVEEPCIKLSYQGVDVLYIQEMLDIKMGIEPDMRKKQLAKAMKKKKGVTLDGY